MYQASTVCTEMSCGNYADLAYKLKKKERGLNKYNYINTNLTITRLHSGSQCRWSGPDIIYQLCDPGESFNLSLSWCKVEAIREADKFYEE